MNANDSTTELEQPKLAELHESILDAETVERLFRDLAHCTRILQVMPRMASQVMIPDQSISLDAGRELLLSGQARGIQVRYCYEDAEWCDTLLRTPAGIRIVRIRHDP
jgi:hypothetical protein